MLLRAKVLAKTRDFFAERNILETETQLLLPTTNPAPFLNSFNCDEEYLQTSPEFAMKKLLARGSGDIYQICKAFRKGEKGKLHNPEFTILEWYRIGFDHHKLMKEVETFLTSVADFPKANFYTYKEIYEKYLNINPHEKKTEQLKDIAQINNLPSPDLDDEHDSWVQLLFIHLIEPKLGFEKPIFIYDFPTEQAMLARIRGQTPAGGPTLLASRFEVYYKGVELANGFHELNDPDEQRQRFNLDLEKRKKLNLPQVDLDEELLKILADLPDCAGVALGIDRLLFLISLKNQAQQQHHQ